MTILKRFVSFNQQQQDITCHCCFGSGKIKTPKQNVTSIIFSVVVCVTSIMTLIKLLEKMIYPPSMNIYFTLFIFIISTILSFTLLKEYKEQTSE